MNEVVNQGVSLSKKEASAIIAAMRDGAVPRLGVQYIMVGRHREVEAIDNLLDRISDGESSLKLWIGDFGSGKSFMLTTARIMAHNRNFVVADIQFGAKVRLHSTGGHAQKLYQELVKSISIKTKPDKNALQTLIEIWLEQVQNKVAEEKGVDSYGLMETEGGFEAMNAQIKNVICSIEGVGDRNFATVLMKYYEGWAKGDELLIENAMRWLNGDYSDKRDAKRDLGVTEIINDDNYLKYLMLLSQLFVLAGYSGFVINMDECYSLYQIVGTARQSNYDVIRNLYDLCAENKVSNVLINLAGTRAFLLDRKKGLYSYGALKTRIELNPYATEDMVDYRQPVFMLGQLSYEAVSVLCEKLLYVFNAAGETQIALTLDEVEEFLNECKAENYTTFREVIKSFIYILDLMVQHPGSGFVELCRKELKGIKKIKDSHGDASGGELAETSEVEEV